MFILRSRGLEKDVKGIVVLNGVIFVGLIAVVICAIVRTVYEGNEWVKRMAVQEWVCHDLRGLNRPRIT